MLLTTAPRRKTFTNLLFLWLGFKGVHNCVSQGHPRIFLIAYMGYVIVGLGSTAFHTSLKCRLFTMECARRPPCSCSSTLLT